MQGGNHASVPAKASLIERTAVTLADGRTVRVELYSGEASDGYQTDYRARPAAWVAWSRREGGTVTYRYVRRYTGRNHDKAWTDYAESAAEVKREAAKQASRAARAEAAKQPAG
jgi:phage gp37-like protein